MVKNIKLEEISLARIKNILRVCINSSTINPCFIEYIVDGLKCCEIGALMVTIYKDEFRNQTQTITRNMLQGKTAALDRKKVTTKLEMDVS